MSEKTLMIHWYGQLIACAGPSGHGDEKKSARVWEKCMLSLVPSIHGDLGENKHARERFGVTR